MESCKSLGDCKNLGEALSFFADNKYSIELIMHDTGCTRAYELMSLFLAQLEEQYLPRPIKENGEILAVGDEVEGGKCEWYEVYESGGWHVSDEDGNTLQDGMKGDVVYLD